MAKYIGNGQIKIEPGDTLSAIYGSNWRKLSGYKGAPRYLQVGTVLPAPDSMIPAKDKRTTPRKSKQPKPNTSSTPQAQDLEDFVVDIIDEFVQEQNKALKDIGVTDYDYEALEKAAIDIITPAIQEDLEQFVNDLKEGKRISEEKYQSMVDKIQATAAEALDKLDIQSAKTERDFKAKLDNIKATTSYNLDTARSRWEDRRQAEQDALIDRGGGFSGRTKERLGELERRQGVDLNEITRRGAYAETAATSDYNYDKDMMKLAREAAERNRDFGLKEAEQYKKHQDYLYGTDTSGLDKLQAKDLDPLADYSKFGSLGRKGLIDLSRQFRGDVNAEVDLLVENARKQKEMASDLLSGIAEANVLKKYSKKPKDLKY